MNMNGHGDIMTLGAKGGLVYLFFVSHSDGVLGIFMGCLESPKVAFFFLVMSIVQTFIYTPGRYNFRQGSVRSRFPKSSADLIQ